MSACRSGQLMNIIAVAAIQATVPPTVPTNYRFLKSAWTWTDPGIKVFLYTKRRSYQAFQVGLVKNPEKLGPGRENPVSGAKKSPRTRAPFRKYCAYLRNQVKSLIDRRCCWKRCIAFRVPILARWLSWYPMVTVILSRNVLVMKHVVGI
jgi:hypothetical protein